MKLAGCCKAYTTKLFQWTLSRRSCWKNNTNNIDITIWFSRTGRSGNSLLDTLSTKKGENFEQNLISNKYQMKKFGHWVWKSSNHQINLRKSSQGSIQADDDDWQGRRLYFQSDSSQHAIFGYFDDFGKSINQSLIRQPIRRIVEFIYYEREGASTTGESIRRPGDQSIKINQSINKSTRDLKSNKFKINISKNEWIYQSINQINR